MSLRAGARIGGSAVLLALLLYVSTGELLQAWVGLHFDVWEGRKRFAGERDRSEWQRVQRGLDVAQQVWPWKTSLYRDAARLQLFGVRGRFVADADAGRAILAATQRAAMRSTENGALLLLEARGDILLGDAAALRAVVRRMNAVAPNERSYQEPLLLLTARRSVLTPALKPVARELIAAYSAREPERFALLAKKSIVIRQLM